MKRLIATILSLIMLVSALTSVLATVSYAKTDKKDFTVFLTDFISEEDFNSRDDFYFDKGSIVIKMDRKIYPGNHRITKDYFPEIDIESITADSYTGFKSNYWYPDTPSTEDSFFVPEGSDYEKELNEGQRTTIIVIKDKTYSGVMTALSKLSEMSDSGVIAAFPECIHVKHNTDTMTTRNVYGDYKLFDNGYSIYVGLPADKYPRDVEINENYFPNLDIKEIEDISFKNYQEVNNGYTTGGVRYIRMVLNDNSYFANLYALLWLRAQKDDIYVAYLNTLKTSLNYEELKEQFQSSDHGLYDYTGFFMGMKSSLFIEKTFQPEYYEQVKDGDGKNYNPICVLMRNSVYDIDYKISESDFPEIDVVSVFDVEYDEIHNHYYPYRYAFRMVDITLKNTDPDTIAEFYRAMSERSSKDVIEISIYHPISKGSTPGFQSFADINSDAWYFSDVIAMAQQNIVSGINYFDFGPNLPTSRAMFITFLYRAARKPKTSGKTGFTDVKDTDWFADAVKWGVENGIVYGMSETSFGPNLPLTRGQMAMFFYRFNKLQEVELDKPEGVVTYKQVTNGRPVKPSTLNARTADGKILYELTGDFKTNEGGGYVYSPQDEAMIWALETKLITGSPEKGPDPLGGATRAMAVSVLARYMKAVYEKQFNDQINNKQIPFTL